MDNRELTKVSMNLSPKSLDNIDELSLLINESNRTRAVSSALEVARVIMEQVQSGKHIILRDKNGSEQELKLIVT